jgi:acyl-CoA thioesterase I
MSDSASSVAAELARSVHPEKTFWYLPGMNPANLAALYGVDEPAYAAIRERFSAQNQEAASSLLADPEFAAMVDRLPFAAGQTLAVIGESTTDAADSWLDILGHLLRLRTPGEGINLVNAAISGYPTTMLQRSVNETLQRHQPGWVVLFAGGNDVLRYGADATKPMVTSAETALNLAEMRRQAAAAGARVIWMTPTSWDPAKIAAYPPFQSQGIWMEDGDLRAVNDTIKATAAAEDTVVDLSDAFGTPPDAAMLRPDGLHPTLAGQTVIARLFVERLAGPAAGAVSAGS